MPTGRAHALELVLTAEDDEAVRQVWARLEEGDVPSSARHRGATHRPHVTLLSGPSPSARVLQVARSRVAPLLPLDLPVAGLLRFTGRRGPLVELLTVPGPLHEARQVLAGAWDGSDDRPWVPHLTLAPRPTAEQASRALAMLDPPPRSRAVAGLRWWDPDEETVTALSG